MAEPWHRRADRRPIHTLMSNPGSIEKVSAAGLAFIPSLNSVIIGKVTRGNNVIYSPLGVHMCLSILRSGAEEETDQELSRATKCIETSISKMNEGYRAIVRGLTEDAPSLFALNAALKPTIHFITCLYIPPRFDKINAQFVEAIQQNYGCRIVTDESFDRINAEVQLATEGRVTNILGLVQKYGNIGMVMVNVLQFRSLWEGNNGFDQSDTRMMEFTKSDGSKIMKKMYASYSNYVENHCSIAALYFEGGRHCLFIYLPKSKYTFGVEHLEKNITKLTMDKVAEDFVRYHRQESRVDGKIFLNVSLPKFTANLTLPLRNTFFCSDIRNILHPNKANFSGIRRMNADENEQLYLSDCIQTVVINIDDTNAPATPNIPVRPRTTRDKVKTFCVNEPFMFSIYDYINNVTIAHGSVYDPLQENSSPRALVN